MTIMKEEKKIIIRRELNLSVQEFAEHMEKDPLSILMNSKKFVVLECEPNSNGGTLVVEREIVVYRLFNGPEFRRKRVVVDGVARNRRPEE